MCQQWAELSFTAATTAAAAAAGAAAFAAGAAAAAAAVAVVIVLRPDIIRQGDEVRATPQSNTIFCLDDAATVAGLTIGMPTTKLVDRDHSSM